MVWVCKGTGGLNYPKTKYIEEAIDAYAACSVKVMITELDVDVLPLTREGQVIGQCMTDKQFQLEEFKTFLDPTERGCPTMCKLPWPTVMQNCFRFFTNEERRLQGLHCGVYRTG
jgi:endo-1,4-beta-xylanase